VRAEGGTASDRRASSSNCEKKITATISSRDAAVTSCSEVPASTLSDRQTLADCRLSSQSAAASSVSK